MRGAFIAALLELAASDPRVWLLTGDLGYSVVEPFMERFPDRFLNVGIAEQNMAGVAAGLAMAGKVVFTYSIANFPTLRCLEQIRNDIAYHNLPVISVAVGGGMAYGSLGYSHHAVEDLAVMRTLPNMAVAAPGDPCETTAVVRALAEWEGPGYLRLGKANEPCVHLSEPSMVVGEPIMVREGSDVTLVSTGGSLAMAVQSADVLRQRGIEAGVVSFPFLNPVDPVKIAEVAALTGRVVTIEEHGRGGLGSLFAEGICLTQSNARLQIVRLDGSDSGVTGGQSYLCETQGLSVGSIVAKAESLVPGVQLRAA